MKLKNISKNDGRKGSGKFEEAFKEKEKKTILTIRI